MTVTARPHSLQRISTLLNSINARYARNVMIDLTVYNVTLAKEQAAGLSMDLVYKQLNGNGVSLGGTSPIQPSSGQPGRFTVSFADANSRLNGTKIIAEALNTVGSVALFKKGQFLAINGQPSPFQVVQDRVYTATRTTTQTANVGAQTTEQKTTLTTGLTANVVPLILGDNRILLQYQFELSSVTSMNPEVVNGVTSYSPEVARQSMQQQAFVKDGDALVLFGITGDLARKMLLPALYHLTARGDLTVPVVGVASTGWDDAALRAHARQAVVEAVPDADPAVLDRLADRLSMVSGDITDDATFTGLRTAVEGFGFVAYYLAVPPKLFTTVAAALARAGRRPGAWNRPPTDGLFELRDWFARQIAGPGGEGGPTGADVLITAGGQSALTTALRALAPPGAQVLVESPTYPGMLAVARAAGQRPVPVPVDADGLRPELLAAALRATGARVLVCQPLFQNPTGAVLARERRREVVRIARDAGAFVVEDDFARSLAHEDAGALPPPLAADDPDGVVVHLRSLTKITSPSLRVGALAARGPVLERLRAIHVVDQFFVPRPLQEAALELVGSPAWPRHLRAVAAALRPRRDHLAAELRRQVPALVQAAAPHGGFHLWVRAPEGTDEAALVSS